MEKEEWKSVPGYPNYEASSLGRVRSIDRLQTLLIRGKLTARLLKGKTLKCRDLTGRGYRYISPVRDKVAQTTFVHRLVCLAFHGVVPFSGATVNHKNFIKHDNRPENLEWMSQTENAAHAAKAGRNKKRILSPEDVALIRFWIVRTDSKADGTARIIAKILGVSHHVVNSAYNRRTYKYLP